MNPLIKTAPLVCLALVVACVDPGPRLKNSGALPGAVNQNERIEADGSNVQGSYAADIWPVNYNLHLKRIGTVGLGRSGDNFTVAVRLTNGPEETTVKQALYTGRRCPSIIDDLNKDAYIDILEARLAIGKITIPFDADLESQSGGQGEYPQVDGSGQMAYSRSASFDQLFTDLRAPDDNPDDQLIKLSDGEGLTFPGRIVLFQGMPRKVSLPDYVATTEGEDKYESIPVGCAVLWRVSEMPRELEISPETVP